MIWSRTIKGIKINQVNIMPTILINKYLYLGCHMRPILSFALITTLFFFSCGDGNDSQSTSAAPVYDHALVKGKVTDSVQCMEQSAQNYALYLPSYYSESKKYPCIFFFDAHARGVMPVSSYKDLAEKYGFVLVGSNMSKNGTQWQVTNEGVKILMDDVRARMNIDPTRIYTSGFSGGARVAGTIAVADGGIAGVIGCAAGFPFKEAQTAGKFSYFGLVGDYDFNLTEMELLDNALDKNGFAHQLLTFGGKHGWPSVADFETALLWMQANAMKENLQPKNDTLVAALKNDYATRIATATKAGEAIQAHDLLSGMVKTLGGLTDVSDATKQLADVTNSEPYKNALMVQARIQQEEINRQQELAQQFAAQNENWWAGKIAALNRSIHTATTKEESQMNKRLLNYLSLVGYMNVTHALGMSDLTDAATYLTIFKMADPENPDCGYLSAVYYMQKGDRQHAVASLRTAASHGYSDIGQLMANPVFNDLRGDAGFKDVTAAVVENKYKQ